MRKLIAPLLLGSALALGACATNPYGSSYGGYGSPYGSYGSSAGLGAILSSVLGASGSGYYGQNNFQQAAVNACGSVAARYGGQVGIRDVRRVSNSTLRVYGVVGTRYGADDFACSFRSDGRITDFDI